MLGSGTVLVLLTSGVLAFRAGYRPARYFLLAMGSLCIGTMVSSMRSLGFMPHNVWTYNALQIGVTADVVLLAFALADRINTMKGEKEEAQAEAFEHRAHADKVKSEFEVAQKIQMTLLPDAGPLQENISMVAAYLPMASVGGDFYDFIEDDDGVGVLVADVSGHGLSAALLASMLKVAFSLQKLNLKSPAAVLRGMNGTLHGKYRNQFVTAVAVYIDRKNRMRIANAGHPAVLIVRKDGEELILKKPSGWIIGVFPEIAFAMEELQLSPGDRVVIFTDGITETRNVAGEFFDDDRFYRIIHDHRSKLAGTLSSAIFDALYRWSGSRGIEDDITLIVLDILEPAA